MLANFLNKSKPINFIGLLIFFFIGYVFTIYNTIFKDGFSADGLFKSAGILILFLLIFFIYNFIISKNKLTLDHSYAYFLFTLLIISCFSKLINYESLISMIVYLLFLRKVYSLKSSKLVLEKLFDSGFWLGILFLLEPLSVILAIFMYVAIYLHNKITIHTIFTPILGFATPLLLYFTYFFWFDDVAKFTSLFNFDINFNIEFYTNTKYFWLISAVFICTLFAMLTKSVKALSVNNKFKKSWILLIINFTLLIIFLLFLPFKNGSELIFIFFPASIIMANGIEIINKKILKNIILYLLLIGSILFYSL